MFQILEQVELIDTVIIKDKQALHIFGGIHFKHFTC